VQSSVEVRFRIGVLLLCAFTLTPSLLAPIANASTPTYSKAKSPKLADVQSLTFRSTNVTVNGKRYTLASKNPISLRFDDKSISINAGCNTLSGKYSLVSGSLRAQTLFSTKMACTEKLMNQDVWLNQLFSTKPKLLVQFLNPTSKIKKPSIVLTISSNTIPGLKAGKTIIKMNLYETYGYADTPLGDENSASLVKETCTQLLLTKATEVEAQFASEQKALIFRVVSRDGEYYPVTSDYSVNRLNVSILDGKVTECYAG